MARVERNMMTGWFFTLGEEHSFDEKSLCSVTLPHDWAVSMPIRKDMEEGYAQGFLDRWGIGWYRKKCYVEEVKENYCYYLDFGGIFEDSTIWINGKEAGGHGYGYSSFKVDITPFIIQGENEILIRVNNTHSPADRWYSGCGIYRTVKWIETEQKHLEAWDIIVNTYLDEGGARVIIQTGVQEKVKAMLRERSNETEEEAKAVRQESEAAGEKIAECTYGNATVAAVGFSNQDGEIVLQLSEPKLWSAETPNLYDLELTMYDGDRACDSLGLAVGIREVKFINGQGMFVNGKKEILKGLCIHQDVGCRGIASTKEVWRQRLLKVKEMGCNCIRPTHHVFSTEFLEVCDELGFYIYEEAFDKWDCGAYERYFADQWRQDVDAMVKRDRNHPCIVIWGVGNEATNQGQTSMMEILKLLCDYVKGLDRTRPVSYAMRPQFMRDGSPQEDLEVKDYADRLPYVKRIGEIVDILGCNYMDQWYEAIHEILPEKLIIGTEVYQYFMGHPKEMQNFVQKVPSLVPEELDYCIGSMIWTGIDYLGESVVYPFKGRANAPFRTNMDVRPMYYVLQSYWTKEPMVHFSVLDYTIPDEGNKWHWSTPPFADHWHFPQFHMVLIPYIIATNCDEVKLYLNEKEYIIAKPSECANRLITGFLPYLPGTVRVEGYRDGQKLCSHETVTPKAAVRLSFDVLPKKLSVEAGQEVLLTVRAYDEENHPVFRENAVVRFQVNGDAKIIAVDNGDLISGEPYESDQIHLKQGQASVMLRTGMAPGRITVRADAAGMFGGQMVIVVKE